MAPPLRSNRGYPPSLRGRILFDASRGVLRARKWPRPRGAPTKEKTAQQNEWFRQAQWLTKFIWPVQQRLAREGTEGTPLMPRDVLTSAMSGRLWAVESPDGTVRVGVPVRNDVSQSLDLLGLDPGSILIRGPDLWYALPPQDTGHVLTSRGPGNEPHWAPPVGAAGQAIETHELQIPNSSFESGNTRDWESIQGGFEIERGGAHTGTYYAIFGGSAGGRIRTAPFLPVPDSWIARIDNDDVGCVLTWWFNGGGFGDETAGQIRAYNASLQQIDTADGPRHNPSGWTPEQFRWPDLPPGTRYIKFDFHCRFSSGDLDTIGAYLYDSATATTIGLPMPFASPDLLPEPSPAGRWIFVTSVENGPIPAFSDGTNWRRCDDRTIISAT